MAKKTTEQFIKESKNIFGENTFTYIDTKYVSNKTPLIITCPEHGSFSVRPDNHLFRKSGCPYCSGKHKWTTEEFIKKAKLVHGDKYDYSNTKYTDSKTKLQIICKKHGVFEKYPGEHINGFGCQKCSHEKLRETYLFDTKTFIDKAKQIHGGKYDYSNSIYVDSHFDVKITCKKHGNFITKPYMHLQGQGCPKCKQSKLENEIEIELSKNGINFEYRDRPKWLEGLELDFYIKNKNVAIECQGIQHYEPVEQFGGEKEFKNTVERDTRKAKLCEENGIKLLYFTHYSNINEEGNIYKNKDKLLEEILHNAKSIRNITESS